MEKLHLADLKAKEAKAKKAKAENGEAGQAADTPKAKPVQRPLSKLDRELAAEKARAEAKQARRPLPPLPPPPLPPLHPRTLAAGPPLHHRAISESRSWCLACAEGGRAREEEGGASAEGRPAQEAPVGIHALQRPSRWQVPPQYASQERRGSPAVPRPPPGAAECRRSRSAAC